MIKIRPGQVWLDDKGIWDAGYDGEMVYVIKSKEPDKGWEMVVFQEWTMGGYLRGNFSEESINKMKYLGTIYNVKKFRALLWRDALIALGFFTVFILILIFV